MQKEAEIKVHKWLYPLAWLYKAGVCIRNFMFDKGILRSCTFPVPVISIGNITVGGTGKTPHTEYLIRLLQAEFQVAVLSRGYKRKSKGFVLASPGTHISQIGDEPYQMAHKFPDIYMAVDRDRCHGIERLTDGQTAPGVGTILLDDAFQHRYVKAGLSILLIDYNRPIYRDALLPAGRLREPMQGKKRADIIIVSKCPPDLSEEAQDELRKSIAPLPRQQVYFSTFAYGKLQPLFCQMPERTLDSLKTDEHILLVTGIASPKGIIGKLAEYVPHVVPLTFGDHHNFTASDMAHVRDAFSKLPGDRKLIVTTEKDAARLISHPLLDNELKPYVYVLPIIVDFLGNKKQSFNKTIIEYVKTSPRNSSFSES